MEKKKRVTKPWGYEVIFSLTKDYAGKIIHIEKNSRLSLQYHKEKEETIYLFSGKLKLTIGEQREEIILKPGDSFHIPPKLHHRMDSLETCDIFEVSTPQLEDVVRLEDDYGREGTSEA